MTSNWDSARRDIRHRKLADDGYKPDAGKSVKTSDVMANQIEHDFIAKKPADTDYGTFTMEFGTCLWDDAEAIQKLANKHGLKDADLVKDLMDVAVDGSDEETYIKNAAKGGLSTAELEKILYVQSDEGKENKVTDPGQVTEKMLQRVDTGTKLELGKLFKTLAAKIKGTPAARDQAALKTAITDQGKNNFASLNVVSIKTGEKPVDLLAAIADIKGSPLDDTQKAALRTSMGIATDGSADATPLTADKQVDLSKVGFDANDTDFAKPAARTATDIVNDLQNINAGTSPAWTYTTSATGKDTSANIAVAIMEKNTAFSGAAEAKKTQIKDMLVQLIKNKTGAANNDAAIPAGKTIEMQDLLSDKSAILNIDGGGKYTRPDGATTTVQQLAEIIVAESMSKGNTTKFKPTEVDANVTKVATALTGKLTNIVANAPPITATTPLSQAKEATINVSEFYTNT